MLNLRLHLCFRWHKVSSCK